LNIAIAKNKKAIENRGMPQQRIPRTEEEIRAIVRQGEDEVVAMVGELLQIITILANKVQELEDKLAKNSVNSSKPPSSDGLDKPKRTRSLRKSSGKKPGAQAGHVGHRLEMAEKPDRVEAHVVKECSACHAGLETALVTRIEKRQEFELPEIRLMVIEHQAEVKSCPQCGHENQAEFPAGITQPTQYGPDFKALLVYLNQKQFIPQERVVEFCAEVFNQPLGDGTVVEASKQASAAVEPVNQRIKAYLSATDETVHFDETSLRVEQKNAWVHSAGTERATNYHLDEKRGRTGIDNAGILPKRTGKSAHDDWAAYYTYDQAQHVSCNAHHLREFAFLQERYPQDWETAMVEHLLAIKKVVAEAVARGQTCLPQAQLMAFETRYDELVVQGLALNPVPERPPGQRGKLKQTPPKNLLDRLRNHKAAVLAFMYDFKVPFDNNLAERDIRMVKLKQKISGCFRAKEGAKTFCSIRGYLSTARKNAINAFVALKLAMRGSPYTPDFLPPAKS
jgi:transposase